ncbi:DUF302 domain-containing protein [[Mycoplasma] testudinis]|uniref:DUF302 domain-containing protein n=1 Tax=[Mycoplasma] testudinis TaxID=33924 RepID=UPI000697CD22|nr:DUF302 domain-containing protein [[Mycoplasma] testudinis]
MSKKSKPKLRWLSILPAAMGITAIAAACAPAGDTGKKDEEPQPQTFLTQNDFTYVAREANDQQNGDTTYNKIKEIVKAAPLNATIFAEIDHKKNSDDAKLSGDQALTTYNKVLVFGNARTGTNLMVNSPGMGLELPLRIQVFQTSDNKIWVSTNAVKGTLMEHNQMNETLANNFVNAVNNVINQVAKPAVAGSPTLTIPSDKYEMPAQEVTIPEGSNAETVANNVFNGFRRQAAADANMVTPEANGQQLKDGAGVFAIIDHKQNAINDKFPEQQTKFNNFNKVLIFGNARAGTALIKAQVNLGLELPIRLHVYVQDNKVFVNTNAIVSVLTKYGDPSNEQRNAMATTLSNGIKTNFLDQANRFASENS